MIQEGDTFIEKAAHLTANITKTNGILTTYKRQENVSHRTNANSSSWYSKCRKIRT